MEFQKETYFISQLLPKVGIFIHDSMKQPIIREMKRDRSPVTEIDRSAERMIREQLAKQFPNDGIIGEEFAATQPDAVRQWIIDPIDGTRAFIGGFPTFTTLLGLLMDGVPVLSAIYQPITQELWVGQTQGETHYNEQRACTSNVKTLESACFATTSHLLFRDEDQSKIAPFFEQSALYQLGGDGYAYGKLASGTVDLIIESTMQPYDFLPLIPIVQGAGGVMTDWEGSPLHKDSQGDVIAASTQELHSQAMSLLHC